MDDRIMSTLSTFPGYIVVKDLGIVWAFDKEFVAYRNLWQMDESLERVYNLIWKKRNQKGANAVLDISFSFAPNQSIPILMGTAVVLEKE